MVAADVGWNLASRTRRWFNGGALLPGWAADAVSGMAVPIAANLTPTYPLLLWGFAVPGYAAFFTVILNLALAPMLTPVFDRWSRRSALIAVPAAA
jgi:hypothetical protein